MRKIENKMIQAIRNRQNWKLNNTEVKITDNIAQVKLHGHVIGEVYFALNSVVFDCCGYYTNTTRSRLNALASICSEYVGFNVKDSTMVYRKGSRDAKPEAMTHTVMARID